MPVAIELKHGKIAPGPSLPLQELDLPRIGIEQQMTDTMELEEDKITPTPSQLQNQFP